MKASLNKIKQYIDFDLPPVDELVAKINAQLGGVEEVIDLAAKYKDAKIVHVVECEKHQNADKLSVCKIDAGTDELVQVVCGAPNVRAGMWAVWLPPESIVPATFDDAEPFKLGARELRGVMSNGMLAASDELAIGTDHGGILEINPDDWKPNDIELAPGASFAKVYGLDDTIIDIENKMFTHRPDLFGHIGVAREIAGIFDHKFTSPNWYKKVPQFSEIESTLPLEVFNDAGENVPRIMFTTLKNIKVKPSPVWLQCALVAMGGKPINNVVDVTNYIMLLTAQPTHAYDYDKIRGQRIGARMANAGESATLLNGKTYQLTPDDIVIADGEGPIGLGGIMGGGNSEVSADTKNIVLEVATFDMYAARKSSMRHGIFTDALTRFNKGQSALQNDKIINLLTMSIKDVAGGEQATNVFDLGNPPQAKTVSVTKEFINERLGLQLGSQEIKTLLQNVELGVSDDLEVTPAFWRTDIELPEDIVEEVGRLYGFDTLPQELPRRSMKPAVKNANLELKQSIRGSLAKAGANEVLGYSFVHEKTLAKAGQDPSRAFKLSNALSPDLQYYRLSITPSLLDKIHMNVKTGFDSFSLFELGKVHYKSEMDANEPSVPNEDNHLGLVIAYTDKKKPAGAPYFAARHYLEHALDLQACRMLPLSEFDVSKDEWGQQLTASYEPTRAAVIVKDEQIWGVVGEFTQATKRAFKIPNFAAGFEVHLDLLQQSKVAYQPLSKFPNITQDVSLEVAKNRSHADVFLVAHQALSSLDDSWTWEISPVTIYQAENADTKTITLRLKVANHERTLKEAEVTKILEQIQVAVYGEAH